MATVYSNVNMVAYERAQLRAVARSLNVPHHNLTTNAAILTAIKAK